ncbi:MAG: hypothetical protein ABIA92_00440 [Patescibacteria group bacterium]
MSYGSAPNETPRLTETPESSDSVTITIEAERDATQAEKDRLLDEQLAADMEAGF